MAQTNFTPILTYKSDTASSVPSAGNLTNSANGAELAVNTADKRLFTKDSGGNVVEVGTNPSSMTLPNGSANGVLYLNGSKVLTSGSALTFDGTNLGVGGTATALGTYRGAEFAGTTTTTGGFLRMRTSDSSINSLDFTDSNGRAIFTTTNHPIRFGVSDTEQMRLTSTGLGIGTSSPSYKLHVVDNGNIYATSAISNSTAGTSSLARFLAISDAGNAVFAMTSSSYTDVSGAQDAMLLSASNASGGIAFALDGTLKMKLDSAGNLGLGVTPSAWAGTGVKAFQFQNGALAASNSFATMLSWNSIYDGAYKYVTSSTAGMYQVGGSHSWHVAPSGTAGDAISFTQAMTLDASGNLGVGTTSPSARLHVSGGASYITGASNGTAQLQFFNNAQTTSGFQVGQGYASNTDNIAYIFNTANAAMVFGTNNTERARIDSSGNLLVGQTTTGFSNSTSFAFTAGAGYVNHINGTASGSYYAAYGYNGSVIGSITQSGTTAVLYNVTSDQRLKENIVDAPEFGSVIDSLRVRSYDWKADGNHQRAGFVAQELVTVAPEAVHQPADPEEMMAVDYSKLVPMLVKEIQSLRQRIAQLETN